MIDFFLCSILEQFFNRSSPIIFPDVYSISEYFDLGELKGLYFRLNIRFNDVPGETRSAKARELVEHCIKQNRINELITTLRPIRPNVGWTWDGLKAEHGENPKTLEELFNSAIRDAIMGNFHSALQKHQYIKERNPLYPQLDEEIYKVKRAGWSGGRIYG